MKVRPYRQTDAKAFIELVRALARFEKLPPPGPAAARRLVADIGKRTHVLLAEIEGRPVGYAIYLFSYSSFLARPTLYLEDLFILPEHRRRGIGGAMFRILKAEARRDGCGRMEWIVLDWNTPAHRFYRKRGGHALKDWVFYRLDL